MSWDKGKEHEKVTKAEQLKDFTSCCKQIADVVTHFPPPVGTAALAYTVACIQLTQSKASWDKSVAFYASRIKKDILRDISLDDLVEAAKRQAQ